MHGCLLQVSIIITPRCPEITRSVPLLGYKISLFSLFKLVCEAVTTSPIPTSLILCFLLSLSCIDS